VEILKYFSFKEIIKKRYSRSISRWLRLTKEDKLLKTLISTILLSLQFQFKIFLYLKELIKNGTKDQFLIG